MNERLMLIFKELLYRGKVQNQSDMASIMGMNRSKLHKILGGDIKIQVDFLKQLETLFGVNKNFVSNGEMPMFINDTPSVHPVNSNEVTLAPYFNKKTGAGSANPIPFYEADFMAGPGGEFLENNVVPEYYMDLPDFKGCIAFRAYSDSMAPLILSGNVLFGKKIEKWNDYLEYGQIYGITMDDGRRFLKSIYKSEMPESTFTLHSQNPNYADFDIPKSAVKNIWLIEGWLNRRV
jgi:Peptidase S24-like